MSASADRWRIEVAREEELPRAMDLAFAHLPDADRAGRACNAMALFAAGQLDPRGVLLARRRDAAQAIFVCQVLEGGTGVVWLPRGDPEAFDLLVQSGLRWLEERGARLAQVIVLPDETPLLEPLVRVGFRTAGPLVYLRHDLAELPTAPRSALRFTSARGLSDEYLGAILDETYRDTLDFPELTGLRSLAEILAGHRAAGRHDPAHWFVAFVGAAPAGVLFLAELEPLESWELSYLGVVPGFRRQGVARALLALGLERVRDHAGAQLEVAVDARNGPALQLYAALGFTLNAYRSVSLYRFDRSATGAISSR